jgi:metal-sulfur cluster biosynthetic enzyme/Fe-S cluster assembly iron-binding protein IscA
MPRPSNEPAPVAAGPAPLTIHVTPSAKSELSRALAVRAARTVVRLFVEPGIHPRVAMILDTARASDLAVSVEGIPIVIDAPSRRFLEGATIDHHAVGGAVGFEVTGPGIPTVLPGAAPASPVADPRISPGTDSAPSGSRAEAEQRVMAELRKLYDPEIPMNIVDLGLIYGLEWKDDSTITVRMTMTSPGCPVIEILCDEVKGAALRVPGVSAATVDVVWDPPWGPDKMTEIARRQLGFA